MKEVEIPDFDDLISLTATIGLLQQQVEFSKIELDEFKADITRFVSDDENFFQNGKPPSMAFITANYHNIGYNDESRARLHGLRLQIAENEAKLHEKELLFRVYQTQIDIWRTLSANQRSALFIEGNT